MDARPARESSANANANDNARAVSTSKVAHGYLEGGPRPLFASVHTPTGPARNVAYVVCQPLHYDLIQCYRSMRRCAEELAAAGFHVLRIQYDGTNESVQTFDRDPDRVAAWVESVERAVKVMRAIPGVESVGIVGVRIGAAFAMDVATRTDIGHLVLWEPVAGAMYAREMEILASSTPQQLKAGGGSELEVYGGLVAGGYWLSKQTLTDLARLDIEKAVPRGKPEIMIVQRDDRRPSPRLQKHLDGLGLSVKAGQIAGHKQMMQLPDKSIVPMPILDAIRDFAVEHSRTVDGPVPETPVPLSGELVHEGLRWKPIRFGTSNHLFGVLTTPVEGPKRGLPAVLLMPGGVVPRTAGNGSYATLAKRLAAKGHAVLRMDVAYIGESSTQDGSHGNANTAFPLSILEDARAGLARLLTEVDRNAEVWMYGLCSGAYSSFQTIVAEPRVRGVFLVNPVAYYEKDIPPWQLSPTSDGGPPPEVKMSEVDSMGQMERYLQVMRDPQAWKKLLSGKADMKNLTSTLKARVGSKLGALKARIEVKLGRAPEGLAGDMEKVLARGGKIHMVFAEGDAGHAALLAEVGPRFERLVDKGLHVKVFAGADHNFHEMTTRAAMIDWVAETIPSA